MLSAEKREKARERWMEMFDAVYSKNESLFSCGTTLIVADTDTAVDEVKPKIQNAIRKLMESEE